MSLSPTPESTQVFLSCAASESVDTLSSTAFRRVEVSSDTSNQVPQLQHTVPAVIAAVFKLAEIAGVLLSQSRTRSWPASLKG